ncbi:MAG: hypothetical protein IPP51_18585 [Bacteroidetes bacterium]|nr:hypothetical protein [Bacteroidota bacterium]
MDMIFRKSFVDAELQKYQRKYSPFLNNSQQLDFKKKFRGKIEILTKPLQSVRSPISRKPLRPGYFPLKKEGGNLKQLYLKSAKPDIINAIGL